MLKLKKSRKQRFPSHDITVLTALNRALRERVAIQIVEPEGWTMTVMSDEWGPWEDPNPAHITECMLVGSVQFALPLPNEHFVTHGTKVQMLAWYTRTYQDTCSRSSESSQWHEFSLWIALPDGVRRFDFNYKALDGQFDEYTREDSNPPLWAAKWIANQERKMKKA